MSAQTKIDEACEAGEEFSKRYYETFDKRRHMLHKLYMDGAELVWNGNSVHGVDKINTFLEQLPPTSHTIDSLDAQPVVGNASEGQTTILVVTAGVIRYEGHKTASFHQNFILTSQANVWKIASDWFRFQENVGS